MAGKIVCVVTRGALIGQTLEYGKKSPRLFWPAEGLRNRGARKHRVRCRRVLEIAPPEANRRIKKASSPFEWIAIAACGQRFSNFLHQT